MEMDEKVRKTIIDILKIVNAERLRAHKIEQLQFSNPEETTLEEHYKAYGARKKAYQILYRIGDYIEELGFPEEVRFAIMEEAKQ